MQLTSSDDFARPEHYEYLTTPFWGKALYPGTVNLVTAPMKAGKTSAIGSLVGALSKGEPWGGIAPTRTFKVFYADLENPDVIIWQKLSPYQNPNLRLLKEGWRLSNFDIAWLDSHFTQTGFYPDIVVVDPLIYATSITRENESTQVAKAIKKFTIFARESNRCVFILHHDRKPQGDTQDNPWFSARGSGALGGAVDTQWNIIITGRHQVRKLQCTFSRYGSDADHEPTFLLDYDNATHITTARRVFE